jgi:hypothetical protein
VKRIAKMATRSTPAATKYFQLLWSLGSVDGTGAVGRNATEVVAEAVISDKEELDVVDDNEVGANCDTEDDEGSGGESDCFVQVFLNAS